MADVHTKEQRSYNMSQIKSKGTKPEYKLKRKIYSEGLRGYRLNYKLTGKPDIVFTRSKLAIFVDGCFWHKCSKCYIEPKSNKAFWLNKIDNNIKRDKQVNKILKREGWSVLRL